MIIYFLIQPFFHFSRLTVACFIGESHFPKLFFQTMFKPYEPTYSIGMVLYNNATFVGISKNKLQFGV